MHVLDTEASPDRPDKEARRGFADRQATNELSHRAAFNWVARRSSDYIRRTAVCVRYRGLEIGSRMMDEVPGWQILVYLTRRPRF
jgi:hypothetical protein